MSNIYFIETGWSYPWCPYPSIPRLKTGHMLGNNTYMVYSRQSHRTTANSHFFQIDWTLSVGYKVENHEASWRSIKLQTTKNLNSIHHCVVKYTCLGLDDTGVGLCVWLVCFFSFGLLVTTTFKLSSVIRVALQSSILLDVHFHTVPFLDFALLLYV